MTDWNQVWSWAWPAFPAVAGCYRWWSVRQRHIHGPVNPKIERPARKMLGHAIREEMVELDMLVQAAGEEVFGDCIALCAVACGYISIDVSGCWWPGEAVRRQIAHIVATKAITHFGLPEPDVYEYLSRVAIEGEGLHEVFPAETAGILPLLITANMPEGQTLVGIPRPDMGRHRSRGGREAVRAHRADAPDAQGRSREGQ